MDHGCDHHILCLKTPVQLKAELAKGYVSHTEDGRAHRYKPLVKREVAGRTALRRLMDKVFDGSPELLLTQLVSEENLSDEELRRLRKLLAGRLREKKP